MKIKLDENIPIRAATVLRSRDLDVDTVLDESLGGRSDRTVLDAAAREGRLLITLDRGFGDIRAYPPGTHPGIVVLRPDDQRVETVVRTVEALVHHHDFESLKRCVTVVQRNLLRVRRPDPA